MIYIIVFFFSIMFFVFSEKYDNKGIGKIFSFLGILLPSILAGLRDVSVGTDTGGYVYYFQHIANISSVKELFSDWYLERLHLEYGYRLINFVVCRFTNNAHWILGIIAFLTLMFIYWGARRFKDRYPTWLIMSAFLFLHYCNDLNVARQGLAVAIVFWGYRYLETKHYFRFILVSLLAMSMHSVTGLAFPLLLCVFIFLRDREFSFKRHIILVLILVGVLFFYRYFVSVFLLIFPQYGGYVERYIGGVPFSLAALLIRLPFIIISLLYYRQILKRNKLFNVYFMILIFDLVISQFGNLYGPFARLTWYFSYYKLLIIPEIYMCYSSPEKKYNKENRIFVTLIIFTGLFLYWFYFAVLNKYGFALPVYPYTANFALY